VRALVLGEGRTHVATTNNSIDSVSDAISHISAHRRKLHKRQLPNKRSRPSSILCRGLMQGGLQCKALNLVDRPRTVLQEQAVPGQS
jgi:hypothetical protein